jgi:hypothetical protein
MQGRFDARRTGQAATLTNAAAVPKSVQRQETSMQQPSPATGPVPLTAAMPRAFDFVAPPPL